MWIDSGYWAEKKTHVIPSIVSVIRVIKIARVNFPNMYELCSIVGVGNYYRLH